MVYIKLLIAFVMITILTVTAAHRHRQQQKQFQDSIGSDEIEIDQRPENGLKRDNNHRGRGSYPYNQGEMRGNDGSYVELQDGYPKKGPVQQPLILGQNYGRGPHRFAEPLNNFQQPTNNYQRPPQPNQNFQGPQQPQVPTNHFQRPQNNFQQQPSNGLLQPTNNFQGLPNNNYSIYPYHNVPQNQYVDNKPAGNPFLPQQPQIQSDINYSPQTLPSTFINKQNPQDFEPVTNELPTTVIPMTTTPSYANPRRTDLLYGSNLLEEDKKRDGKSSDNPDIIFEGRVLLDSAPHCKSGYILVHTKCRLQA